MDTTSIDDIIANTTLLINKHNDLMLASKAHAINRAYRIKTADVKRIITIAELQNDIHALETSIMAVELVINQTI